MPDFLKQQPHANNEFAISGVTESSTYVNPRMKLAAITCFVQMNDIQKELQQLRSEEEQHSKDTSQYSNLERTYEGLLATVKQLEVSHISYRHSP